MKRKLAVLAGLLACTLLYCGCGDNRVDSITFDSMQSESPVTLNVSGYSEPRQDTVGQRYYGDTRTKQEMIDELKQNNLTYFELYGHEFFTLNNGQGTYHLSIEELTGSTSITIDDLSCRFGKTPYVKTLFPAFMLSATESKLGYAIINREVFYDTEYLCNGEELLALVKKLGLWTVEEQTDYFIMRYQTESIGVHVGDGTVTLEYVASSLPQIISYETILSEEEILADLRGKYSYGIQEYHGERYILSASGVYRVVITPQTGKDFKNQVQLDPMITEISTADRSIVCTIPFPYFHLSSYGETCTNELTFNSTYDVDKRNFLLYLRSVRGWSIVEDGDTVILRHYNLAVNLVFNGDTVTIYPCE